MQFLDDSLLPENQDKLVITVAPYGPEWAPGDYPEDIPVSMDEHVQKAVDCYVGGGGHLLLLIDFLWIITRDIIVSSLNKEFS